MGVFSGDIFSESLRMTTHIQVIFPDASNDVTPLFFGEPKVLYLLHGLGANCDEWTRLSRIEYYANKFNFIVIMPEGQRSFYCDALYGPKFFTYISEELPAICSRWFRMDASRENTYIAGESMGGYGAVKAGLRHPERYAGVGTLSGALDYKALCQRIMDGQWTDMFPQELQAVHGPTGLPGEEDDVIALVKQSASLPCRPKIIQLCGTEDFLYEDNQRFRQAAEKAGCEILYKEGPGDHEWPYWDKAIQHVFQFFRELDIDTTPIY